MIKTQTIGILGGTFDPIHLGHVQLAEEAYHQLDFKEIKFIPCNQSSLKTQHPIASANDRLAMVKLAIKNYSYFTADDREIKLQGISYTVDTLKSLRQENPNVPLCFIMSMDAFAQFNLWHNWQEILTLANLIIANRPDSPKINNKELLSLLKERQIFALKELQINTFGKIYFLNIKPNPISATTIRSLLKQGLNASQMLDPLVWDYIKKHKLYF